MNKNKKFLLKWIIFILLAKKGKKNYIYYNNFENKSLNIVCNFWNN